MRSVWSVAGDRLMEPVELRMLWDDAGGGDPAPRGAGLLGLQVVDDPVALTGMALAVLGLPLDGAGGDPAAIRRVSQRYGDWLPALSGGFRAADCGDVEVVRDDPAVAFMQAHERLADIIAAAAAPLVLGGDALVSVPVLQVLSGKLRGRLGVVAFTPAYEIAPDPLYASSSRWARALELGVLSPANLALVGGRAAPPDGPARRVLDGLGATTFSLEDVLRDGMATVAQEALETAAAGTEAVYLSVDLGVVAGIGDPVGLQMRELAAGVAVVSGALLAAADVCGPGPSAGAAPAEGHAAAGAAARVAAEIVAGVARRLS
jgi:arginase family enzyme